MASFSAMTLLQWLLRIVGGSICLALVPIFFPLPWMEAIHGWLGLGEMPNAPIFEYLARSTSGMYFAHGVLILVASTDVRRFLPVIWAIGCLNFFLGAVLLVTDLIAPMPWYWTAVEGPPIMVMGAVLLGLTRRAARQAGSA